MIDKAMTEAGFSLKADKSAKSQVRLSYLSRRLHAQTHDLTGERRLESHPRKDKTADPTRTNANQGFGTEGGR